MRRSWLVAFGASAAVAGGVITMITGVSYEDAQSNAASWYNGLIRPLVDQAPPQWLIDPLTDYIGFAFGSVLLLLGTALLVAIYRRRLARRWSSTVSPVEEQSRSRLVFVYRRCGDFFQQNITTASDLSYAHVENIHWIGVRNIDPATTVHNVHVRLIGASDNVWGIPMDMEAQDGTMVFDLDPDEMKLIKFASQIVDAEKGGREVWLYGGGDSRARVLPGRTYKIRIGAYGLNASATIEVTLEFDQDRELLIHPKVIGDYPEGRGRIVGTLKIRRQSDSSKRSE